MSRRPVLIGLLLVASGFAFAAGGDPIEIERQRGNRFSIVVRDAPIAEVFEMLSAKEEVNVLLGKGVEGNLSLNLFDVSLDQAVRSIAEAAGYVVERRRGAYLIIPREDAGQDYANASTVVRTFKIQYSDVEKVGEILEKHLSRHGEITHLKERRVLVVEDLPSFLSRIEKVLHEIDREPQQILLEAKILEITLDSADNFGIDWAHLSTFEGDPIVAGARGLTNGTQPGLFAVALTDDLEVLLESLSQEGRVRALATPTLLTLENQEAEVLIGDRLGFRVTTTINQVTTESIEFIDSGVILRFKPSVDRGGRVLMEIHPEVSTGVVTDGIPSVTTTEVTTQLLARDGQPIFIGGLIRDRTSEARRGIPLLGDVPWLGLLFSRSEHLRVSTETVVLVTPHVVGGETAARLDAERRERLDDVERFLDERRRQLDREQVLPWSDEGLAEPDAPPAAQP